MKFFPDNLEVPIRLVVILILPYKTFFLTLIRVPTCTHLEEMNDLSPLASLAHSSAELTLLNPLT